MKYLHSLKPQVIHSDLNCKNVLVSEQLVAKVTHCFIMLCSFAYILLVVKRLYHGLSGSANLLY